jgi:hypothetical protein
MVRKEKRFMELKSVERLQSYSILKVWILTPWTMAAMFFKPFPIDANGRNFPPPKCHFLALKWR